SSPAVPEIAGLADVAFHTNETVFDLKVRPEHLIVVGAGPTGLELAQAFRRLGAVVTVLDAATPLAREDPECAAVVVNGLRDEGIDLRSGIEVVRVESRNGGIAVAVRTTSAAEGETASEITISGTHLLLATGRRANIEELALDNARIKRDGGAIRVDESLKTSNKRVYGIGDVTGHAQFTHVANYH